MEKICRGVIISLVLISFLASCSDERHSASVEFDTQVSFTLGVENAISTRAISDGTGATQLMYAVFEEGGNIVVPKSVKDNVTGLLTEDGFNMTISLAKGNTYRVVFWAQNSECTAYTVSDDMKVSIDYEGVNNDETRDAFFAVSDPFTVSSDTNVSVVLRRPFAQVNVGVWEYDMVQAVESGVVVSKSSAAIKGVPSQINLFDGTVSDEENVYYDLSAMPEEDLLIDVDGDKNMEAYKYLSMSYLLAGEKSTHEMSFVFTDEAGSKTIQFNQGLGAVPIQRNFRTNIVGQILSGDASFNIKIDPVYEGETVNSGGLYYNFSEDVLIEDQTFAFSTDDAATFTSENNDVITMTDVTFSGRVQYIAMGEYRDKGNYVDFTNVMTNVKAENMVVDHPGIENVKAIDYMAPLVFLRGVSTLENCTFTGTTTTAKPFADNYGDMREVLPYDCGVPNFCKANFNNCTVDRLYAWSHSIILLTNSTVKYIRCSTHNNTSNPYATLTVGAGTVVDEIFVTSSSTARRQKDENGNYHWVNDPSIWWSPSLIIKSGATVKVLDMNGRSRKDRDGNIDVIIEEGAIVEQILNEKNE